MKDVFHKHSTLFGLLGSACLALAAGGLTNWNIRAIALAFFIGLLVLPRTFYGWKASAELERLKRAAPAAAPSFYRFGPPDAAGIGAPAERLSAAYEQAQDGDPSALRKLAEEEERQ
jgi:hypothetical protein